jgi:hypothetical protein
MSTYEILSDDGGIAALAHDADGGTTVHGVIIGEGDTTTGLSNKETRWPGDVLEQAAGLAEGHPITMADSLDPEQHVGVKQTDDGPQLTGAVSIEEKVGEITGDAYADGVGWLFEGFIADWEAEDVVERGLAQVSPVVVRDLELVDGEPGEPGAVYEATEVTAFRDLAIVADGAAPSNEITVGQSPDMTATAEALSEHFDVDAEALSAAASGGQPPGGDDGPDGGSDPSTPANSGLITMDLTDNEQELVAAARQKDDPTVVEAEVPDRLSDLEEQLTEHEEVLEEAADIDEPAVMEADEAEAMTDRVAVVESMLAEALQEEKGLRESTVEAMSFEAMAAEFQTDDGDLDVEALTQTPETGSGPSTGGDSGVSDDDRERIQAIDEKLDAMGSALPAERVEALQEEAADLAGEDDYDAALEVL